MEYNKTRRWTSGPNTRLMMDVSLTHIHDCYHRFTASNIRDAEQRKRNKYADFYQRQGYAFAPMKCNTLGECGQDMLHFLCNLADRSALHHFGLNPIEQTSRFDVAILRSRSWFQEAARDIVQRLQASCSVGNIWSSHNACIWTFLRTDVLCQL